MKYFESSHLIFACASVDGHCTGHAAGMKGPQAVAVRKAATGRIDIQSMVFHPNITF